MEAMTKASAIGREKVKIKCMYMSWLWVADELSPRGVGRGAAADEAAHLDAHQNRDLDLVPVEEHVDLQGQTHVG